MSYVFHHKGQKIGDSKKAWKTACKEAKLQHWFTILEGQRLETSPEREYLKLWLWKLLVTKPATCIVATGLLTRRPPRSHGKSAITPGKPERNKSRAFDSQPVKEHGQKTDNLQTERISMASKLLIFWWSRSGSNRRPLECHSSALPAELRPHTGRIG